MIKMRKYAEIIIIFLAIVFIMNVNTFGADHQTPGSSIAKVIRPWPGLGERAQSKNAMEKWAYNTSVLKNEEINLEPTITISDVLNGVYRGWVGAVEISTHGTQYGHSIEVYEYSDAGKDKRNIEYNTTYQHYHDLLFKGEKDGKGYFIAIRYSALPSYVNESFGMMGNAIFHNQCCYGSQALSDLLTCGAVTAYGPSGAVTETDGASNVEILWNNLGKDWYKRKNCFCCTTGDAYTDCPNLQLSGAVNIVLGPAVTDCSQENYTEVPPGGLDVQLTLDTDICHDPVLFPASDAVDVYGNIELESVEWVDSDGIKAVVKPKDSSDEGEGTVTFIATQIVSAWECTFLYMNGGENYSLTLNSDGDPAATVSGFYVCDGVAHWKVSSEYKTAGYRIDGTSDGGDSWEEVAAVDAGIGNRMVVVGDDYYGYRLVEIEEGGRELIDGVVRPGERAVPPENDVPAEEDLRNKLAELARERERIGFLNGKSATMGEGEEYVIFTVDSLADEVDSYVAEYWRGFGYSVVVNSVDNYPADPDSFRTALKDSIAGYAEAGAMYFHLIGDANDWQQFSTPWPGEWEQIRQDYLDGGYPAGGQPEKDLIPTWSFPDTLPRDRCTSYFVPYTLTDKPYSDTDGDGIPDVVVTRWPVTTEAEVLALAYKMQWYMDCGVPETEYSVMTCVGDLYHMESGDGDYAARVADTIVSALPAGQDTSFIYESDYFFEGDRNTAVADLWNEVDPSLVLMVASCSNRSKPGNFFVRVGTSNPFHMDMLEDGYPAVVFGFSCDTGDFARTEDSEWGKPVFERFLVEGDKGAVAWIGPVLGSWQRGNRVMGKYLVEELYGDLSRPVAESFLIAQQRVYQDYPEDSGMLKTVDMYAFLGHPLLRMYREAVITAADGGEVPVTVRLAQNHPNPFNPATEIEFSISCRGNVELVVYDVSGRRVRELVNGEMEAGRHRVGWDGRNDRGVDVASGLYFYRLKALGETRCRKMVLLR